MVKIGIIGGGFSGLGIAYFLKELKNHKITILEEQNYLGGLASGFKKKGWDWSIEKLIHHWFSSDKLVLDISKDMGLGDKIIIKDTKSSCFYKGKLAELDSPSSILKFPFLSFFDRVKFGLGMAILRFDKNFLKYEKETSFSLIKRLMGNKIFNVVWEPLFLGKFGKYAKDISASWFWARVHPRTKDLAYVKGGFQSFINKMAEVLRKKNTKIILNARIKKIRKNGKKFEVISKGEKFIFDYLVLAVPLQTTLKLYDFPKEYVRRYQSLKSIGAQYFVLELKKPFLEDGTYWLNINEKDFPFMMVAEHTNFVDKKYYGNSHLIWVGKYLDYDNPLWKLKEKELLKKIIPYLKKINPKFKTSWIKGNFFFRFKNAQPILPLNYSKKIPKIETPIENLYIANMNHIYPWDRGTNNALEVGLKVAKKIKKKITH